MPRKWSDYEIQLLRKRWNRTHPQLIAKRLDRTPLAVLSKAQALGLRSDVLAGRHWTPEEEAQLREMWGHLDLLTIARRLERTGHAVTLKAKALKLPAPSRVAGKTVSALCQDLATDARRINYALEALGISKHRVKRGSLKQKRHVHAEYVRHEDIPRLQQFLEENPRIYRDTPEAARTTRGAWGVGKKAPACIGCGTSAKPHHAKDRCYPCYNRYANRARRSHEEVLADDPVLDLARDGADPVLPGGVAMKDAAE